MKTTAEERALLVAQATSAHRSRTPDGQIAPSAAWMDLDESGRREAHEQTLRLRAVERALSSDGLSSTVRAVLGRIRAAQPTP